MHEFTVITAPQDLLPQVVGELLAFAVNPDLVQVVHGSRGREIHAHPEVAEAWYLARQQIDTPAVEPVAESALAPEPQQEVPSTVKSTSISEVPALTTPASSVSRKKSPSA